MARTSMSTPGGHPPSMGDGIVRARGRPVNDRCLLGQIAGPEEEAPPLAPRGQPPLPMETAQVVRREARDARGLRQIDQVRILLLQNCFQFRSTIFKPFGLLVVPVLPQQRGILAPLLYQVF